MRKAKRRMQPHRSKVICNTERTQLQITNRMAFMKRQHENALLKRILQKRKKETLETLRFYKKYKEKKIKQKSVREKKIPKIKQVLNECCCICLEKTTAECRQIHTCKHRFHSECILKWYNRNMQNPTCPLCRQEF